MLSLALRRFGEGQTLVDAAYVAESFQLTEEMAKPHFEDKHDHFDNANPNTEYKTCLAHAEKIGLGNRQYELVRVR